MSDSTATIEELKEAVKKFCDDRDWDQFHGPKELAIGASTEAAELLAIFRFLTDQQIGEALKDPKKREHMSEELADTFYFILRFAQMYGFDLSEGLASKLEKNEKKYPADKWRGSNKKYNEM